MIERTRGRVGSFVRRTRSQAGCAPFVRGGGDWTADIRDDRG